ncbi:putative quinol monooxygenase [Aminobacter sp. UC22_36]|uniref:putative quinol monooxygenase n=1 Tax=Aminobacter sp. UC22_36 TaxID=3374549 RepID=UPI0037584B4A
MTIIVEFETLDGAEEQFLDLISEHARATLQEEPGCLRFEVIKPVERDGTPVANKVMVNALYADDSAVAVHERNPRMADVQAALSPLLKSRRLILARSLGLVDPNGGMRPEELNAANDD